jgi:hypothetical protein
MMTGSSEKEMYYEKVNRVFFPFPNSPAGIVWERIDGDAIAARRQGRNSPTFFVPW